METHLMITEMEYVLVNTSNRIVRSFGSDKDAALAFMSRDEWKQSTIRLMAKTTTYEEIQTNEH